MNIGKETEFIEFKESTADKDKGIESMSSILNKHGKGTLYFGVKDNGDVKGQTIGDSTLNRLSQDIARDLKPQCRYSVSSVTLAAFQSSGCSSMYLMMSCCRYITYGFFRTLFSPLRSQYWIVRFSTPRIRDSVFLVSMSVFAMNPPMPSRCLLRKTAFSERFRILATVASGYFSVNSSSRISSSWLHALPPI